MELSENHKSHLLSTFQYIDKLFSDIEQVLSAERSHALFKQYSRDISPRKQEVLEQQIAEFRTLMEEVLKSLEIAAPQPHVSALHAILTAFTFIDIALEELNTKHMRGYGEVSQKASGELDNLVRGLQESVERIRILLTDAKGRELQKAANG